MTEDPVAAYTATERRHMWVWGTAWFVLFVLGMAAFAFGNTILAVLVWGLGSICANTGAAPWRPRMKVRRERRLRDRGLLRETLSDEA
jgi:hypothetical protein